MKKALIYLFFISLPLTSYCQLDPLYNQYLFNQGMINPAYTGIYEVFNASLISRAQWAGFEGAPVTNTLNASSSIVNNKVGVGATLIYDSYGINNNTEIQLSYSYKLDWLGNKLSFGLQTGIINYNYDYSKLNLEEAGDLAIIDAQESVTKKNFGAGVWYMNDNYYVGVSVPRILDFKVEDGSESSTRYRRHFYLSAGYLFDQLLALKFKPSVLVRMVDSDNMSLDLNAQFLLNDVLWLGASFRDFNAAGLNAQLEIMDRLRAGYSFEMPLNTIELGGYGTHELMITLDLELFSYHAAGGRYF